MIWVIGFFSRSNVYQQLLINNYTAIRQLVNAHLGIAISIYSSHNHIEYIFKENIPLYKGRDNNRVLYISGVALQLSKSQNLPSMDVANAIVSHLSAKCIKYFNIQIVSPGWIHLELSHQLLATWLQNLVSREVGELASQGETSTLPLPLPPSPPPPLLSTSASTEFCSTSSRRFKSASKSCNRLPKLTILLTGSRKLAVKLW